MCWALCSLCAGWALISAQPLLEQLAKPRNVSLFLLTLPMFSFFLPFSHCLAPDSTHPFRKKETKRQKLICLSCSSSFFIRGSGTCQGFNIKSEIQYERSSELMSGLVTVLLNPFSSSRSICPVEIDSSPTLTLP